MADVEIDIKNSTSEELVSSGLKAYILRDYNAAVEALTQAIEVLVSEHGEKHDSLGNVYLHYGKALLEISREESEALGDAAVPQMNDESDDDDEEESAAPENGEAKANGTVSSSEDTKVEGSDEKKVESSVEKKDDAAAGEKKVEANGSEEKHNEPSTSGIVEPQSSTGNAEEGETTEEKNEEATDLQVAWEVLELAKLIFEQRGDEGKKELADTLVTLGEVSVESENFDGAIVDIQQGLVIQKDLFDAKSRHLAGTYYKLAVALSLGNKIEESIDNFNIASNILKDRLTVLQAEEDQNKEEIKDIETLIPEIAEKIADMKSYKEEAANKIASALIGSISSSTTTTTAVVSAAAAAKSEDNKFDPSSSSGSASDISHLVKRKRKLDEIAENCEENAAKKHNSA